METLIEAIQGALVALSLIIMISYFMKLSNRHQTQNKPLNPLVIGKKLKSPIIDKTLKKIIKHQVPEAV
jgi:hypothetical protein